MGDPFLKLIPKKRFVSCKAFSPPQGALTSCAAQLLCTYYQPLPKPFHFGTATLDIPCEAVTLSSD